MFREKGNEQKIKSNNQLKLLRPSFFLCNRSKSTLLCNQKHIIVVIFHYMKQLYYDLALSESILKWNGIVKPTNDSKNREHNMVN